ncbi:hypothetical protein [Blautia fusiformis]|jgi:hypothetical protein|uniref:Uncharacterized protein n=1 Tax=Blautia fusiformis TaxID=2881264 RepID=A0AAW4W9M7_9FIRM|nr:hypothetical protein [Blautia fusiformis]MCC2228733.1 hypothetical protein [Blautia fusiformis]DAZ00010.1 MAG TPA: hypothetical protein [Caudoviricetes sp.]
MKVKVGPRMYQMSKKRYRELLEVARQQVLPIGVYAIEKSDYAELRNDHCVSVTKLKATVREFRQQGFKVHYNSR